MIFQILKIFESNKDLVNKKVFYVGDMPIDLFEWANAFSKAQIGRKVIIVPRALILILAKIGDTLKTLGINFPITTSRYKSMTTDNPAPMENTFKLLGNVPYSLEEGVKETVDWLKKYYPELIKK